ncbi:F-box domain [Macleaya cordata]|uniref:F-box domain n=1 Tax=Macleaya cordata TaxID=56857 RepID=A0A200PSL6_MACCD|nr:F-box domain [Macleaya cordata]OVA01231.1 F-box domain [Macleaya cordata]
MSSLPEDIIVDIFLRLPVKSILRFRCVCKPWCKLFSGPDFVKMHLKRGVEKNKFNLMIADGYLYLVDHDSLSSSLTSSSSSITKCDQVSEIDYPYKTRDYIVEILGPCNGLLCIISDKDVICIWNPSTKEYKELPTLEQLEFIPTNLSTTRITYGFGYNCNIEDYKLVRIETFYAPDPYGNSSEVMVYSLRSNSWKSIQDIPYDPSYGGRQPGVLVNGALHWIATRWIGSKARKVVLVSFDIGDETFKEVPPPEHFKNKKFHKNKLGSLRNCLNVGVLGGCLCVLCHLYKVIFVDVWVMKDYGVRESWTKLFTIVQEMVTRPFVFLSLVQTFDNGEILLQKSDNALLLYDMKQGRSRILKIRHIRRSFEVETYVESLVSPNLCTYKKKLKKKNKNKKKNKKKNQKNRGGEYLCDT